MMMMMMMMIMIIIIIIRRRIRSIHLYEDVVWFIQILARILGPTFEHFRLGRNLTSCSRDLAKAFKLSCLTNSFWTLYSHTPVSVILTNSSRRLKVESSVPWQLSLWVQNGYRGIVSRHDHIAGAFSRFNIYSRKLTRAFTLSAQTLNVVIICLVFEHRLIRPNSAAFTRLQVHRRETETAVCICFSFECQPTEHRFVSVFLISFIPSYWKRPVYPVFGMVMIK